MLSPDPVMSVVVLVDRQRVRAARCLRSVLDQSLVDRLEVLLVDVSSPGMPPLTGSDHASVRVLRLSETTSLGEVLAAAVLEARAPLVALIEEHCTALPGWAEALVDAHRGPAVAIGGERHNPAPERPLARFIHFLDDGPWTAPATAQPTPVLPEGNVAYKRDVLLRYRDRLEVYFQCEGLLYPEFAADGLELRVEPAAKYLHEYDDSLNEAASRWFWQGYVVAATRAELAGWTPGERRAQVKGSLTRPRSTLRNLRALPKSILRDNRRAALLFALCVPAGEVAGTVLSAFGVRDRTRSHLINGRRLPESR